MLDARLADEAGRLAALDRHAILDTPPEAPFERITTLVGTILQAPMVTISLVDRDRQWFKARVGIDACETPRAVSFCSHTIRARTPLLVPDARVDPRFRDSPLVTGAPHIASYAGVPLTTRDGYNLGALCVLDRVPRFYSPAQIEILTTFAALVVDEIELREIASRDHLTGVLTRRAFLATAADAIARSDRAAALLLLDLDHFKAVNDRFGHAAGDTVLESVAATCGALLRTDDSLGRLGGEEFAIVLAGADVTAALAVAERCRGAIAGLTFTEPGLAVTASVGVAALDAMMTIPEAWLDAADLALYAAKGSGRNRCRVFARAIAA